MDQLQILVLLGSVAVLLAVFFLCMKPEYALFFYGLALGFPDFALPLGSAVNLRVDDTLILLFVFRSIFWKSVPLAPGQRKILGWQVLFLFSCMLSALIETARGVPPPPYETAKMIGCFVILMTIPRLLQSENRLRFLIAGLASGGIALAIQIVLRLGSSSADIQVNFQEYKNAATFATWNPNTVGQAAMLLTFAAGLGGILFSKSRVGKVLWPCLAFAFVLMPASMFVRGTTLSIVTALLVFLELTRQWKWILAFLAASLLVVSIQRATDRQLFESATRVDVSTGEGFSHRFDRWETAIGAIRAEPFLGHGFGQEWVYLSGIGSEGRAHNAYLTVWIELGIGGVALLLAVVFQILSAGVSLYRQPEFRLQGALLLALILAQCLDSFGLPTLYCEKLPTISISIVVALVGICERKSLAAVPQMADGVNLESVPQHT